ncbi:hypothetical protein [Rippkaea orientalis]|nr:hypothetical protein [Rippkaea orientalis]
MRISLKNVTHHWGCFHSDRANMIREDSHGSQAAMTLQTIIWRIEDYHPMIEAGLLEDRRVELLREEIVTMSPERPEPAQLSTDTADHLWRVLGSKVLILFLQQRWALFPLPFTQYSGLFSSSWDSCRTVG